MSKLRCSWCENLLSGKQTRFCSQACKISQWRHDEKVWAVEYKGGHCMRCKYDRSYAAMVFHHESGKVFKIGDGGTRSRERLQHELDKCELICCNCHAEEHHPRCDRPRC